MTQRGSKATALERTALRSAAPRASDSTLNRDVRAIRLRRLGCLVFASCLATPTSALAQDSGSADIEWRHYAADRASTKYSPAAQIDATNVEQLELAWQWETPDTEIETEAPRGTLKGTPLMKGGVLYAISAFNLVSAIDAASGEELWTYDPRAYERGRPVHGGFTQRGLEFWSDGSKERLIVVTGTHQLISLDPSTGEPDAEFGEDGMVDMRGDIGPPEHIRGTGANSPAIVCGGTILMGMVVHDFSLSQEMPAGDIRGYDVHTGEKKWVFHTVPQEDEPGVETWHNESWRYSGNTNVWSMITCDDQLGWVYLPVATPTSDYYGGHRHGDNLYAESLVALDARTGEKKWHFQAVHHGLWDYDFPCAPILVDLERDGWTVRAVAQVSKQGFTYVFDRISGEPLWPIEERPVEASDVPGEWTAPTQPFPTKPPPFDRQGVFEEDLIDFTQTLHAEAREILAQYKPGPLFTPPIVNGAGGKKAMIQLPGQAGGANWGGAALDPTTNLLYVPSQTRVGTMSVVEPGPRQQSDRRYLPQFERPEGLGGLPLVKPPWKRVTAIDLSSGDIAWQVPLGRGPKDHPALAGLDLPDLGTYPSSGLNPGWPLVTQTLLFVAEAGVEQGNMDRRGPAVGTLHVFDKATGKLIRRMELPEAPTGGPMTYTRDGRQFVVVPVGQRREPHRLLAFSLPAEANS